MAARPIWRGHLRLEDLDVVGALEQLAHLRLRLLGRVLGREPSVDGDGAAVGHHVVLALHPALDADDLERLTELQPVDVNDAQTSGHDDRSIYRLDDRPD